MGTGVPFTVATTAGTADGCKPSGGSGSGVNAGAMAGVGDGKAIACGVGLVPETAVALPHPASSSTASGATHRGSRVAMPPRARAVGTPQALAARRLWSGPV